MASTVLELELYATLGGGLSATTVLPVQSMAAEIFHIFFLKYARELRIFIVRRN
jgi:hypothetical protein